MQNNNIFGFETDTVWGIGCDVEDNIGYNKIYEIKGREKNKPLILMSYDKNILLKYVKCVPDIAKNIMDKFWPGGLTLIFQKSDICPDFITYQTLALRIPNHPLFCDVCLHTKSKVLLTTSLNFSGDAPVQSYEEAVLKFGDKIKIFPPKEGFIKQNVPSTIVDFSLEHPKILRQGNVDLKGYI